MAQSKLAEGSSDNTRDCSLCYRRHSKEDTCTYRGIDDSEFYRCERCHHCNRFKPITDEEAENTVGYAVDDEGNLKLAPSFPLKKATLNRWRWKSSG